MKLSDINLTKYEQDLYEENDKISDERNQRTKYAERYPIYMDGKAQYSPDVISAQLDLETQCYHNQNPSTLFLRYGETHLKVTWTNKRSRIAYTMLQEMSKF